MQAEQAGPQHDLGWRRLSSALGQSAELGAQLLPQLLAARSRRGQTELGGLVTLYGLGSVAPHLHLSGWLCFGQSGCEEGCFVGVNTWGFGTGADTRLL